MRFKIIKTNENNKEKLSVVPSIWEDNNILKWPRNNEAKHIKNESTPKADWKQIRCVVKRYDLPNYETADYVLKEMLNHTDTEDDANMSAKKSMSEKPLRDLNLNVLADDIVYPATSGFNKVLVEIPTASGPNIITSKTPAATFGTMDNLYEYVIQDNQSGTNEHQCCTNQNQNVEIQAAILSNQTQILDELKSIKNVQNIMIQKVSLFSIQLEDALSQFSNAIEGNYQVTNLDESRSTPSNTAFHIKPVENIQQLNELEQQLAESSARQKMKNTYSVVCNGGKAIDCAYTLADILFTRDVLCQCTWSGGSRGSDTKVAFKSFKHIMSFFWDLVHSWDNTYTITDNERFFKNILKNAKKRKMAKNQRASTSRKRAKLSKAKNANDYETSDEDLSSDSSDDSNNKESRITEEKIQKKHQEAEKETKTKDTPISENNPEEICQISEKESDKERKTKETPIAENNPEEICQISEKENDKEKKTKETPIAENNPEERCQILEKESDKERKTKKTPISEKYPEKESQIAEKKSNSIEVKKT